MLRPWEFAIMFIGLATLMLIILLHTHLYGGDQLSPSEPTYVHSR
jgi:hypothetical protein